jgi:hypothetical protein
MLRPIRALWLVLGVGKCASPDEGTEGDERGSFHGYFRLDLGDSLMVSYVHQTTILKKGCATFDE